MEGYKADCTVKKTKVATAIADIISGNTVIAISVKKDEHTHTKQRRCHT